MGQTSPEPETTDATENPEPVLEQTPATKPSLAERLESTESWLGGHRRLTLIALLLLASFLRLITWTELEPSPCFYHYEHSEMDMLFFHQWAQDIVTDSLLSDFDDPTQRHPLHFWHKQVASQYLSQHPEAIGGENFDELSLDAKDAAAIGLWDDWYRGKQFHQEPLYPYMLSGIYSLVGASEPVAGQFQPVPRGIKAVYVLQMVIGVLSVGLIYLLTRRYFGDLTAVLAAGLTIGYAPLLYFEFILLRATWICFAGLLLVWMAERLRDQQTRARWISFGLVIGLVVMLKTTMLLFGLGAAALILWPERKHARSALTKFGLMAAGGLIAISPVIVRNLVVGAPALSMTSVGAVTLVASNYPGYQPSEGWNPAPAKVSKVMGESHGSLAAALPATIASHDSVFAFGELLLAKFLQIWHWYEIPNNAKFYLYQLYSKVLQWLPTPFWLTAPFGLYGLGLALLRRRKEGQRGIMLMLLIATTIIPMVAFYVLSRFRVPMVLAMSPFAAYGMLAMLKETRRRHLLWTALGLGLCMLLINREIPTRPGQQERETVNYFDIRNHMSTFWGPRIQLAEQNGDYAQAAELLSRFLDTMPPKVRAVSPQRPPTEMFQARMTKDYGTGYMRLADTLEKAGLEVRASRASRRGKQLLEAAEIGWDRLVEADPRLKHEQEMLDKINKNRREGPWVQIELVPPTDWADTVNVANKDGTLQPVLFQQDPREAKNGAPLQDGKSPVLIIGSDVQSILLRKHGQQVGIMKIQTELAKGKVNTIRIRQR